MERPAEPHSRELYEDRLQYWTNALDAGKRAVAYAEVQIAEAQQALAEIDGAPMSV